MIRRLLKVLATVTLPIWIMPAAIGCFIGWIVTGRFVDPLDVLEGFLFGEKADW
jgi:hypothetical protein